MGKHLYTNREIAKNIYWNAKSWNKRCLQDILVLINLNPSSYRILRNMTMRCTTHNKQRGSLGFSFFRFLFYLSILFVCVILRILEFQCRPSLGWRAIPKGDPFGKPGSLQEPLRHSRGTLL